MTFLKTTALSLVLSLGLLMDGQAASSDDVASAASSVSRRLTARQLQDLETALAGQNTPARKKNVLVQQLTTLGLLQDGEFSGVTIQRQFTGGRIPLEDILHSLGITVEAAPLAMGQSEEGEEDEWLAVEDVKVTPLRQNHRRQPSVASVLDIPPPPPVSSSGSHLPPPPPPMPNMDLLLQANPGQHGAPIPPPPGLLPFSLQQQDATASSSADARPQGGLGGLLSQIQGGARLRRVNRDEVHDTSGPVTTEEEKKHKANPLNAALMAAQQRIAGGQKPPVEARQITPEERRAAEMRAAERAARLKEEAAKKAAKEAEEARKKLEKLKTTSDA